MAADHHPFLSPGTGPLPMRTPANPPFGGFDRDAPVGVKSRVLGLVPTLPSSEPEPDVPGIGLGCEVTLLAPGGVGP